MPTITYPELVRRLYDLERLAEPPTPGERSGSFSSYDRRSQYNAATGWYDEWDANDDSSGFIRREGDYLVAFESEGPGVIWRVWSARPGMGHIQIFIDDLQSPVLDIPFRDFFEQFGSEQLPLNFPQLNPTLSRGRNRFIPIPYNRYCKVRLAPSPMQYFHFTYTTFPHDTMLPSFAAAFDRAAAGALAHADRLLARRGWDEPRSSGDALEQTRVEVAPGATAQVCSLSGNRAITGLKVLVEGLTSPADQDVLRELALSIKWDGESQPGVWSPLGDFFGAAPGVNYYRALPLGMTEGGFYSHWYMPFARNALVELTNDGPAARAVTFSIRHKPLSRSADELLRFHAKWHRDAFLERSQHHGRDIDWPFLLVEGQGRFCGLHLHVWNRWQEALTTGEHWWWGEGDEKFFVDGELFPSTFGTGSEDYIGYAWAAEPPFPTFDSAYACQPWVEPDANGHTSVNRFHICDDVPFNRSFEGCIEKYKRNRWGNGNHCLYDTVAYWYQRAGQTDPYPIVPIAERVGYYAQPAPITAP